MRDGDGSEIRGYNLCRGEIVVESGFYSVMITLGQAGELHVMI